MNTAFLLMARYDARPIIPLEDVQADYFPHMTTEVLVRKASRGDIKLPLVRIEGRSQKSARGVHLQDLADYIDERREAARKEMDAIRDARLAASP